MENLNPRSATMLKNTSKLTTLIGLLLLAGCGESGLTAPFSADAVRPEMGMAEAPGQDIMVPVRWTYAMSAQGTDILPCPNSDGSPTWMAIPIHYAAEGRMTHLGRLDPEASGAVFTECRVNIVGGMPLFAVGTARVELVGANGDAVFLEGELTLHFADNTATGEWSIVGGTGRFEGADGWMDTTEQPGEGGEGSEGSGEGMMTAPGPR